MTVASALVAVLFATHPRYLDHMAGHGHPERPARLEAVMAGAQRHDVADALAPLEPRPASRDELERVHPAAYLDAIERFCRAGGGRIDADTAANSASWDAAVLAAGAGLSCVEALDRGEGDAAFCAVRPPGHHATTTRAMGFCLVNNVAVTAAALAARGEQVLIVDYDAHHGNGTQAVFYDDPRVLYVSFHEYPLYPGTGALSETGVGPGEGFTVNFPVPEGTTGEVYLAGIDEVLAPIVARFEPTWLLLSAGFDAHRRDPITGLGLSAGDFAVITRRLCEFVPRGRRIALLEGGYDLQALADSTAAALGALAGVDVRPEVPTCGGPGHEVIVAARRQWAGAV
jgi:acetoin utilization deacetylase AcuC-like enzyme